jgi:ABC-type phosphate transport system substrate-binding protein
VIIVILDSSKGKKYMDIAVRKRFILAPLVALLIGLGAVCCMVFADTSSAAAPAGLGCQSTDGKISGRGSTYQTKMQEKYASLYGEDICGKVLTQFPGDPSGETMVAYNYPNAKLTGSGNGEKGASCRTDAFTGTDVPYTQAQLLELNEVPGKEAGGAANCPNKTNTPGFEPPFQPKPEPYPNVKDITAKVMAIPIGGSSVALSMHLTEGAGGSCPTTALPSEVNLTPKEVSKLYGGDYLTWNAPELVVNNPELKECSGTITRVVRADSSGTTNILKQYLIRVDNARTGAECKGAGNVLHNWEAYFSTNTEWPGKQSPGTEGTCSPIVVGTESGGPALIKKLQETVGGIGYIDLAEVPAGVIVANVENATGTETVAPSEGGEAANCSFSALSLPGSSATDSVGLNTSDDWSNNNQVVNVGKANHENATNLGSKYPICGLTFDLVYEGLHENNVAGEGAISRLTADQRRTLYSYFTFVLSSTGQHVLPKIHYAELPSSWLPKVQSGFQTRF